MISQRVPENNNIDPSFTPLQKIDSPLELSSSSEWRLNPRTDFLHHGMIALKLVTLTLHLTPAAPCTSLAAWLEFQCY